MCVIHSGSLLVLPRPPVTAHRPVRQPQPNLKKSDSSGRKVSVMPVGKPLSRAKVRGNLEWMVEEGEEKFRLPP